MNFSVKRWQVLAAAAMMILVFFVIGNAKNEVLEIQNHGATMCMACIGLE
ncbi:MAG: hypothetical protein HQL11_00455 [Candidatus Omnitrophica bacterium]|nr:hypothetical protein [Candidatus Omnitrophota bacterium]